jgi:hypothetical protein
MGIAPGAMTTRVLAMSSATETILKARLTKEPAHPRALWTLLEAIALWQGRRVRAALAANDEPSTSDSSLFHEAFSGFGDSPLYTLDWVPGCGHRRPRRIRLGSVGEFRDLEKLLIEEVAR